MAIVANLVLVLVLVSSEFSTIGVLSLITYHLLVIRIILTGLILVGGTVGVVKLDGLVDPQELD